MASETSREKSLKIIIYGLEKALWRMLGKSCLAASTAIGEEIFEELEEEFKFDVSSLEFSEEEALREVGRLLVESLNIASKFDVRKKNDVVSIDVENCFLMDVENRLIVSGIKPFLCPFLNLTAYILRRRLKKMSKIETIEANPETKKCRLKFKMIL